MVHLSRPRVMSMKKKMIAQKKEKGIEAMASLGTKVTANKRLKTGMKKNLEHMHLYLVLYVSVPSIMVRHKQSL